MSSLGRAVIAALAAVSIVAAQGAGGLPQCVKGEYGCDFQSNKPPAMFGVHNSAFGQSVAITRYEPSEDGENCSGRQFKETVTVHKEQCITFPEQPFEEMTLNYLLPNNKMLNHCDITMYDGKDCRGYEVWKMDGTMSVHAVNGQRFCHKAPWAKSVFLGPCS